MEEKKRYKKVYKIKYSINLMNNIGEYQYIDKQGHKQIENEGVSLVSVFNDTDEIEIFNLDIVKEVI